MIKESEVLKAKELIAEYEKQQQIKLGKSVECTIFNLKLMRGTDGHWLCFETKDGKTKAMINIENVFPRKTITDSAIRQWAIDQTKRSEG